MFDLHGLPIRANPFLPSATYVKVTDQVTGLVEVMISQDVWDCIKANGTETVNAREEF